jgi:hypothetical protein
VACTSATGRGGQGRVFEVDDVEGLLVGHELVLKMGTVLDEFGRVRANIQSRQKASKDVIDTIRNLVRAEQASRGALKQLLQVDDAVV